MAGNRPRVGNYFGRGEETEFAITYSEPVVVTGRPRLPNVALGGHDRGAYYDQARSTPTKLVFVYEVTSADTSSPGSDGVRVRCRGREIELAGARSRTRSRAGTNGQDTSNSLKLRCFLSPVAITVSVSQAV